MHPESQALDLANMQTSRARADGRPQAFYLALAMILPLCAIGCAEGNFESQAALAAADQLASRGQQTLAAAALHDAIAAAPLAIPPRRERATWFAHRGYTTAAIEDWDVVLAAQPGDRDALLRRAQLLLAEKRVAAALVDLQTLLDEQPEASIYLLRGTINHERGDWNTAAADFTRAIELDPQNAEAWAARGQVRLEQGELQAARQDFASAEALAPGGAGALGLAAIDRLQGNTDQAFAAVDKLLEAQPFWPLAHLEKARLHQVRQQFAEAEAELDLAVRYGSQRAQVRYARGEFHRQRGNYEAAMRDLQAAVELSPDCADYQASLGLTEFRRKQFTVAQQSFERALAQSPKCAAAWYGRGLISRQNGFWERARDEWSQAIQLAPNAAEYYASRAELYADLGQPDLAAEDLNRAAELSLPAGPTTNGG